MDKMNSCEVNDILENIPYLDRSSWEQSRMTSYIIAQCNSRRKLTQQDILKFKWEDMGAMMHKKESVVMSDDELKRLKNLANALSSAQFVEIDNVTDIYAKDKKSDIRHEGSQ